VLLLLVLLLFSRGAVLLVRPLQLFLRRHRSPAAVEHLCDLLLLNVRICSQERVAFLLKEYHECLTFEIRLLLAPLLLFCVAPLVLEIFLPFFLILRHTLSLGHRIIHINFIVRCTMPLLSAMRVVLLE
jgi:hypothetical protein